ncbi:MAG: hypothetical protein ABIK12_08580 [Pseudomonadota bacterium]
MTATVDPKSKPAYKSRTIWGAVLVLVSVAAKEVPPEWLQEAINHTDKIAEYLGIALVVYGRLKAKLPIGKGESI